MERGCKGIKPYLTVLKLGFVLENPMTDITYVGDMYYQVSRLAAWSTVTEHRT